MKSYLKGLGAKKKHSPPTTSLCSADPQVPLFATLLKITGVNRAVLRAVLKPAHRTEQIWTALSLSTDPAAEVRLLGRRCGRSGHTARYALALYLETEGTVMKRARARLISSTQWTPLEQRIRFLTAGWVVCGFLFHLLPLFLMSSQNCFKEMPSAVGNVCGDRTHGH